MGQLFSYLALMRVILTLEKVILNIASGRGKNAILDNASELDCADGRVYVCWIGAVIASPSNRGSIHGIIAIQTHKVCVSTSTALLALVLAAVCFHSRS